jgi:hypothetical protein
MAVYYVRKTGNNSNAGTSPGAAFLTIAKLLQTLTAGDVGYIGAGVYRESGLNFTNNGSAGNVITVEGDLDGTKTGDRGLVRITASADDSAYTNSHVFNVTRKYLTLRKLWMDMSSSDCFVATTGFAANEHITIEDCWITNCRGYGIFNAGQNAIVRNCRIWELRNGNIAIYCDSENNLVERNIIENIYGGGVACGIRCTIGTETTIRNNLIRNIDAAGGAPDAGILVVGQDNGEGGAELGQTVNIYNNTIERVKGGGANASYGVRIEYADVANVYNNVIQDINSDAGSSMYGVSALDCNTVNENYNTYQRIGTSNVNGFTGGGNSKTKYAVYVPPLPSDSNYFLPAQSEAYDAGTSSGAPTNDLMNNPRPGAFGYDMGAFEKQGEIKKETTTVDVTPASCIEGAGYVDFKVAVRSGQTYTFSAKMTRNSSYGAGTQPKLEIIDPELGMSGSVSFTGSADTYQTCSIPTADTTPSADGVIILRFSSFGTATAAKAFIDSIIVSE